MPARALTRSTVNGLNLLLCAAGNCNQAQESQIYRMYDFNDGSIELIQYMKGWARQVTGRDLQLSEWVDEWVR